MMGCGTAAGTPLRLCAMGCGGVLQMARTNAAMEDDADSPKNSQSKN